MYRRPRRSRFTATLALANNPAQEFKRVILAYDAESVREHYDRIGYLVLGVVKGDTVNAPAAQRRPAFRFDQRAIGEAIVFLGLTLPIKLRMNARVGSTLGNYRFGNRGGLHHNIMVKSYLTAEQASETLWHELCHAMQAERESAHEADPFRKMKAWNTCHARGVGVRYQAKPIEVEAREYEAFAAELPLAVAA